MWNLRKPVKQLWKMINQLSFLNLRNSGDYLPPVNYKVVFNIKSPMKIVKWPKQLGFIRTMCSGAFWICFRLYFSFLNPRAFSSSLWEKGSQESILGALTSVLKSWYFQLNREWLSPLTWHFYTFFRFTFWDVLLKAATAPCPKKPNCFSHLAILRRLSMIIRNLLVWRKPYD